MKIYTKTELDNMQSGSKENVFRAEKTFITLGDGPEVKAILLSDVVSFEEPKTAVEEPKVEVEKKVKKKVKK